MLDIIKLYLVDLSEIDESKLNNLKFVTEKDIENANRYKIKDDRNLHLISSYLKRKYIGSDYFLNEFNKPISNNIYFNVSHTSNLVVLATSLDFDVGVDAEKIKEVKEDLKKYVSSLKEYPYIKDDEDFYKLWTSKESLVKCLGIGLGNNTKDIPSIFSNEKVYKNVCFNTKTIKYKDYIISVTINQNIDFDIDVIKEGTLYE